MKIRSLILGAAAGGCAVGLTLPTTVAAAVSEEAFNALSDLVNKQGQALEDLKKTHQQDQQQIQQLQQQLGETSVLATNAEQKAEAASQAQTVYQAPNPATSATHNFIVTGDAEVQFGKTSGQNATFALADFAPIFLFRANDDTLFEAGFDITLNNNVDATGARAPGSSTTVSLSFAQMDYNLNDYLTLAAGDVILPLGTYSQRAAGWLNKIPDDPLIRDWLPGSGIGAMLQGAAPIGQSGQMVTYAVYGVNGPSSGNATNGVANASDLDLGGNVGDSPNWHPNPSGGGRVAWFYPWKVHYDVELGVSGQTGEWSDNRQHRWSACVLDAALHLGPYFEAKGEYVNTWFGTDDLGNVDPHGVWVQAAYKLAGLKQNLPLLNNLELVARYDNSDDAQGTRTDRYTVGYVYYLSNTLLFEGDYEFIKSHGPTALPPSLFVFQLSYGF